MFSETDSLLNCVGSIVTQKLYHTKYLPEQNNEDLHNNSNQHDEKHSLGKNKAGAEPLSTRNAVKLLLEERLKSEVCRYCLKCAPSLSELDKTMEVASNGSLYKITLKDMIAAFHPFKVNDDPHFPNKICELCVERAIAAYLFAQQCERAERALGNCFQDIYDKLDKLDPLERPKKRGRHKLHPNHNIIHAEHRYVMDYAEPAFHLVSTCGVPAADAPVGDLECLKCSQLLPNLEALLNHTKSHPKSMWYHCRLCGRSFARLTHLKKHFRLDHGPAGLTHPEAVLTCATCGVTCDDHYQYLQHLERHKFKKLMTQLIENKMDRYCSLCLNEGSAVTSLDSTICVHGACPPLAGTKTLRAMLATTLPEINVSDDFGRSQICESCVGKAITAYVFAQHTAFARRRLGACVRALAAALPPPASVRRPLCVELAAAALVTAPPPPHLAVLEERYRARARACPVCGKRFTGAARLGRHAAAHLPRAQRCRTCCLPFRCAFTMREHRRLAHAASVAGAARVACEACGRAVRSRLLRAHRAMHSGRARCALCGRALASAAARAAHERRHWARACAVAAACSLCARVCRSPRALRAHVHRHVARAAPTD